MPIEKDYWDRELTPDEAQAAYDAAPAIPLSKERIQQIVDYATGRRSADLTPPALRSRPDVPKG